MANTTNGEEGERLVDRLPIVITGEGVEKTLSIPKLTSGINLRQNVFAHYLILPL